MSMFDFLQESNDKNWSLDAGSYNPMQSSVLGKSLAPTAPNGDLAAVDAGSDSRTPDQFKQDAQEANRIATSGNEEDYHVSKSGNKYDKFDNSALQQGLTAAAQYMTNYFASNGNVGKAASAAGQALFDMDEKEKRYSKIDELEATGHNPQDIQRFLDSGDAKDLVTNKGEWSAIGDGRTLYNKLTGETKVNPNAGSVNAVPVKTENLGDRVIEYYADGTTKERSKGAEPKALSVAGASGGGIGIDEDESNGLPAFKEDANGGLLKLSGYAKDGTPHYTTANSKDIETYNAQKNAGAPDANQQLVTTDLQTVNGATDDQLNRITGQLIGRSSTARDIASGLDPETRKVYTASERLTTQMGNAAISAAKAAGASGINTEAEIKRFTQGVPQVDYTSEDNYKASIKRIQDYADNYKNQLIKSKGGNATGNNSNHLSDDDLLKKYGG